MVPMVPIVLLDKLHQAALGELVRAADCAGPLLGPALVPLDLTAAVPAPVDGDLRADVGAELVQRVGRLLRGDLDQHGHIGDLGAVAVLKSVEWPVCAEDLSAVPTAVIPFLTLDEQLVGPRGRRHRHELAGIAEVRAEVAPLPVKVISIDVGDLVLEDFVHHVPSILPEITIGKHDAERITVRVSDTAAQAIADPEHDVRNPVVKIRLVDLTEPFPGIVQIAVDDLHPQNAVILHPLTFLL
jgi:hypothetical protein